MLKKVQSPERLCTRRSAGRDEKVRHLEQTTSWGQSRRILPGRGEVAFESEQNWADRIQLMGDIVSSPRYLT
jgi:hypothetical protein